MMMMDKNGLQAINDDNDNDVDDDEKKTVAKWNFFFVIIYFNGTFVIVSKMNLMIMFEFIMDSHRQTHTLKKHSVTKIKSVWMVGKWITGSLRLFSFTIIMWWTCKNIQKQTKQKKITDLMNGNFFFVFIKW